LLITVIDTYGKPEVVFRIEPHRYLITSEILARLGYQKIRLLLELLDGFVEILPWGASVKPLVKRKRK